MWLFPRACYFGGPQPKTAMLQVQYWHWLFYPHPRPVLVGMMGRYWMSRLVYGVPCCPIFLVLWIAPWPTKCVFSFIVSAYLNIFLNMLYHNLCWILLSSFSWDLVVKIWFKSPINKENLHNTCKIYRYLYAYWFSSTVRCSGTCTHALLDVWSLWGALKVI